MSVIDQGAVDQISKRLDRIEDVLDKVRDALTQMARTEEKVGNLLLKMHDQDKEIIALKTQLSGLLREKEKENLVIGIAKKFLYALCLFLVTYVGTHTEQSFKAVEIMFQGINGTHE